MKAIRFVFCLFAALMLTGLIPTSFSALSKYSDNTDGSGSVSVTTILFISSGSVTSLPA